MGNTGKKWLKIGLGILIGVFIMLFIAQWYIKNKLTSYIENDLPKTMKVSYSDLSVNIFSGSLEVNELQFFRIGQTTNDTLMQLKLHQLLVKNVGYWSYLVKNTIHVSEVALENPTVYYNHNPKVQKSAYKSESNNSFEKTVIVDGFNMENGYINMYNLETDSLMLHVKNTYFSLKNIRFDAKTQKQKIPIAYNGLHLMFDSLFFRMGDYDDLRIGKSEIENKQINLQDVTIKTKYSKKELSRIIPKERDHYNIRMASIELNEFDYGFRQDSILQIKSPQVLITEIDADIYRDKLVADDMSIKPLYSKMLRDLKFDLAVDEVKIVDTKISYSEKVKADRQAGTVNFNDFQAIIKNVSNTYVSPAKTTLDIRTEFMNHAPLHANWEFDVNNVQDRFLFQAEIDLLKASYLNTFLQPNLNVRLEGELEKTYLTIDGNDNSSQIDFKTKYENFDVVVLREDGKEKNKFLSDVVNIFVSKNSNKRKSQFVEVTKQGVERNKNQSVFNYIWINTRAGLLKAMTFE